MVFHVDPIITTIAAAIAMFVGNLLKQKTDFKNRFIPIITLVITFLGQIISAANAEAGAIGNITHAIGNGAVYVTTVMVWLATTGFFSVGKNTVAGKTGDAKK